MVDLLDASIRRKGPWNFKDIPSNHHYSKLSIKKSSIFLNISKFEKLNKIFMNFKPDFVFHLAAQSLVKKSIESP